MRVDVFPTANGDGALLLEAIRGEARRRRVPADFHPVETTTPFAVAGSVAARQAVVLDLTPELDGVHRYTAMAYPWQQDHVLAVSRTYLPINVAPRRQGGAAVYPGKMTNAAIAAWVVDQLIGPAAIGGRSLLQRGLGLMGVAAGLPERPRPDYFISYRGGDVEAAHRLRDRLSAKDSQGRPTKRVTMYEPGALAHPDAVLPALLRWNILAVISDTINEAGQTWVVDSKDFLGSWFTQGEMVCVPYFGKPGETSIVSFDPRTGRDTPAGQRLRASLNESQRARLARFFTNSHPDLMAPESTRAMRALRATGLPMAHDEVFDERFWHVPLLQCPRCSLGHGSPTAVDAADFLTNRSPRLYPVAEPTLAEHAASGRKLPCPNPRGCRQQFRVGKLPPYYLWHGLPVGPGGSHLETIAAYSAVAA